MKERRADDHEPEAGAHPAEPAADPISIALKKLHETVIAEDVPEDFLSILAEIDRKLDTGGDSE